ncbi:MAG: hypothetical protein WDO19_09740 [Bacteroidota bacterium]
MSLIFNYIKKGTGFVPLIYMNDSTDRLWYLLAKKLAGEASWDEVKEVKELLSANPWLQEKVNNITIFWNQQQQFSETEINKALKNLRGKNEERQTMDPEKFEENHDTPSLEK